MRSSEVRTPNGTGSATYSTIPTGRSPEGGGKSLVHLWGLGLEGAEVLVGRPKTYEESISDALGLELHFPG